MKKVINSIWYSIVLFFNYILKIWDKFYNFILTHYFAVNVIFAIFIVYVIVIWFDKWWFSSPMSTPSQVKFLDISVLLWAFAFMFQAFALFFLEKRVKKLKKELNKKGFIKFIEYEYKKNDASIFSGLTYILSISISFLAIYTSFTSMQLSLDIAKSKDWVININWTEQMFSSSANWIWAFIVIFILYFIWYKFNQLSKRNYLEIVYYWEYRKN